MAYQQTIFAFPMVFATVLSLGLASYALRKRRGSARTQTIVLFAGLAVAVAFWTGFATLKLVSTDPGVKLLAYRLLHVGSSATAPLLLLFVIAYTDRRHWIRPSVVVGLFVVPVAFVVLLFLDPGGLVIAERRLIDVGGIVVQRTETGPAHVLLSAVYTRVLGACTLGLIGYELYRQGRSYLPQAGLLAIAILTPVTVGLLTEAGVPPFDQEAVNYVPASTAISVAALGVAVWRYELLDLPPIAYRTAVRYSPDGVLVLDADHRIVHANPRVETLLECEDPLWGDQIEAVLPVLEPLASLDDIVERQTPSGEEQFLDVRAQPLQRWGEQVGWVLVLSDVTDRRRRKRDLETFTGVVSHDLRQPLRTTEQYLQLLEDDHGDALEEDASELLAVARRNSRRMRAMISDLQEYSRIEREERAASPVDVQAVVEVLLEEIRFDVEDRDATVVVEDLPTVQGNEHHLRRLFQNLLVNALEHTDESPTIRCSATRSDRYWEFAIEDGGPGIDQATVENVFGLFTRGPGTDSEGTGMGLAIAERIVQEHGGSIWIDSEPGRGTTVRFTLSAEGSSEPSSRRPSGQ